MRNRTVEVECLVEIEQTPESLHAHAVPEGIEIRPGDVVVVHGAPSRVGFGEHGDDYVRIALVENEQRIRQAARNIRRFFETADATLHNVVPIARTA